MRHGSEAPSSPRGCTVTAQRAVFVILVIIYALSLGVASEGPLLFVSTPQQRFRLRMDAAWQRQELAHALASRLQQLPRGGIIRLLDEDGGRITHPAQLADRQRLHLSAPLGSAHPTRECAEPSGAER